MEDNKQEVPEQETQEEVQTEGAQNKTENIDDVKNVAALAYLIFFIPLLSNPESEYGKFHANQGLLLLITGLAVSFLGSIPFIGWFIILPLGFILVLVLFVMGIVNAVNGKKKRLPLIGGIDIIK